MGALSRITGFWEGLTGPSRRLLIGAVLIFLVGVFLLTRLSGEASYSTLATASTARDAAAITSELEELGIPYKLGDGGTTVQVPSEKLDSARLDLAASNVLEGGSGVGYEIFDKSGLGATDFTNRVNLVRAMEGELSRTIGRLDQVSSATVKIGMPEEQLFTDEQQPTTAAVVLDVRPGQELEPAQVKGVTKLVAMAVPGLKTGQVTITDSQGNVLEGADDASGATAAAQRMELESNYERRVQSRLDGMLAAVLGPGKAVTQVRAQLNLDQVTTDSETFDEDSSTPLETQTDEETLNSTGGGGGGATGATPNTPGGTTYPAGAAGAGGETEYSKTSETTRNGVDRTRSQVVKTPGEVVKQTVSVQVSDEVPNAVVAGLEDTIASAVGFDAGRGDTISVQAVPFSEEGTAVASAAAAGEEAAAAGEAGGLDVMGLAKTAAAGIGVLLLALFARRSLRRRQTDLEKTLPELLKAGPVPVSELPAGPPAGPTRQLEGQRKTEIEAEMEDLARRKPDDVAQLLRGWLLDSR